MLGFHTNNMRIASSSTHITYHEFPEGKLLLSYKCKSAKNEPIKSISWSKDGGWLMQVPAHGPVEIITLNNTPKLMQTIKTVLYPTCAAFQNTTKRNIAIGTESGQVLTYDIKAMGVKQRFPQGPSIFFKVQFTSNDNHLVAGCMNGEVYVYNVRTVNMSGSFRVPKSRTLTNFRCHPCKAHIISACSEEGIVNVWDINKSKTVSCYEAHRAPVTDLCFSTIHTNMLLCGGMDRRLCIYDTIANTLITDLNLAKTPTAIDFSSDGVKIALGFQNGVIAAFDIRHMKKCLCKFAPHSNRINQILFERSSKANVNIISFTDETADVCKDELVQEISDSSFYYECSASEKNEPNKNIKNSTETADSFMLAMGLNGDSMTPLQQNVSDFIATSTHIQSQKQITIAHNMIANTTSECHNTVIKKQPNSLSITDNFISKTDLTSTPNEKLKSNISAIISENGKNIPIISRTDFKNITAELKEDIRKELESMTKEILSLVIGEYSSNSPPDAIISENGKNIPIISRTDFKNITAELKEDIRKELESMTKEILSLVIGEYSSNSPPDARFNDDEQASLPGHSHASCKRIH